MRITYIHQHFSFPAEAGGQRPWQFASRLAKAGHSVTVVCGGETADSVRFDNLVVHRVRSAYSNTYSTKSRIVSFARFMVGSALVAVRTPTDLVFASSTPLTTAVPGLISSFLRHKPFVFEVRDLWPSVPIELGVLRNPAIIAIAKLLERLTYLRADRVIALSPGMAEGVRTVSPKTPIAVIPNASDIEDFAGGRESREATRRELGWGNDETVIVYAGSFGTSYDVMWLVELAAELTHQSGRFRVILYGEGASSEAIRARVTELGLDPASMVPGKLPKSEIFRILPAADFSVSTLTDNPALEVNSLNKVFDALAAATPVLFNHSGWLPHLLAARGAGIRLPRDPLNAAGQLSALVAKDKDRRPRSHAAFALGEEQFSRDQLFSTFLETLESVGLTKKGPNRLDG